MSNICEPINTLEELYNFMKIPPKWGKSTTAISRRSKLIRNKELYTGGHTCHISPEVIDIPPRYEHGNLPKTLVCHDMKNGYHNDKYVDGDYDSSSYTFYHWASIDIFIYFSHHFITIPPLGWINVAHKHGVKILGTIITEWNEGLKTCEEFLKSDDEMKIFIQHLVSVTKYFKMDGWLLNIENEVKQVARLIKFVKEFTDELHKALPNSLVIWYDSVINTGSLQWQNALNHRNKDFFDGCDGIFTNYCWGKNHLQKSVEMAGDRKHDVFVGVDVWGRNFWGGGCFNTVEAVQEIFNLNLSMAIFAPAWTHEAIQLHEIYLHQRERRLLPCQLACIQRFRDEATKNTLFPAPYIQCATKEYFLFRENSFWCTLRPYLNTCGPTQLPFHTFFCLGSGDKRRLSGKVITNKTWFNLREQQYQLTNISCSHSYILLHIHEHPRHVNPNPNLINQNQVLIRNPIPNPEPAIDRSSSTCLQMQPVGVEPAQQCEFITANASVSSDNKRPAVKKLELRSHQIGCISFYMNDSFYGGNCVKISPFRPTINNEIPVVRLLQCEFHCDNNFIVYHIVKRLFNNRNQDIHLLLTMKNNKNQKLSKYILCGNESPMSENHTLLRPLNGNNDTEFEELRKNMQTYHPGFYVDVKNDAGWLVRYYYVKLRNSTIYSIDCQLRENSDPMLLGGFGVINDIVPF